MEVLGWPSDEGSSEEALDDDDGDEGASWWTMADSGTGCDAHAFSAFAAW